MRTIDLSPAMIGRRVTVKSPDLYRSGRLNDLTVRTVNEGTWADPHRMVLTGITVMIGGDHIELDGSERLVVEDEWPIFPDGRCEVRSEHCPVQSLPRVDGCAAWSVWCRHGHRVDQAAQVLQAGGA